MLPAYVAYLSGTAAEVSAGGKVKGAMFRHSLAFVVGFSTTIIILGMIAAIIGRLFSGWMDYSGVVGGLLLLMLSLQRFGVIHLRWLHDRGLAGGKHAAGSASLFRSYITGFTLAFGWQVTLIVALTMVASLHVSWLMTLLVLLVYSAGFSVMFFITFIFSSSLVRAFRSLGSRMIWVDRGAGLLMMGVALLLIFDDNNALKTLADWKTGPIIKALFHGHL